MVLRIIHAAIAVALIGLILLQERSLGLSSLFGEGGGFYQTRRGLERIIFMSTIVLAVLFAGLSIFQFIR